MCLFFFFKQKAAYEMLRSRGGSEMCISDSDSTAAQPDSAVMAIVLGFSVLPALLTLASLFFLRGYSPPMPHGFATYGPESEVDRA